VNYVGNSRTFVENPDHLNQSIAQFKKLPLRCGIVVNASAYGVMGREIESRQRERERKVFLRLPDVSRCASASCRTLPPDFPGKTSPWGRFYETVSAEIYVKKLISKNLSLYL
jgi:hypothetical protein